MKQKSPRLLKEERELNEAIDRGEYVAVPNVEREKSRYAEAAKATFAKQKTVNVRISERNLMRLKAAAARRGVSYQTLITSLIQEHV